MPTPHSLQDCPQPQETTGDGGIRPSPSAPERDAERKTVESVDSQINVAPGIASSGHDPSGKSTSANAHADGDRTLAPTAGGVQPLSRMPRSTPYALVFHREDDQGFVAALRAGTHTIAPKDDVRNLESPVSKVPLEKQMENMTCTVCGRTPKNITSHNAIHHNPNSLVMTCSVCRKRFGRMDRYKAHVRRMHASVVGVTGPIVTKEALWVPKVDHATTFGRGAAAYNTDSR